MTKTQSDKRKEKKGRESRKTQKTLVASEGKVTKGEEMDVRADWRNTEQRKEGARELGTRHERVKRRAKKSKRGKRREHPRLRHAFFPHLFRSFSFLLPLSLPCSSFFRQAGVPASRHGGSRTAPGAAAAARATGCLSRCPWRGASNGHIATATSGCFTSPRFAFSLFCFSCCVCSRAQPTVPCHSC